jgi:putative CRISPR-associated protein (TIGR02619 family)
LLLVSTCGTSVLTNETDPATRTWLNQISNQKKLSDEDERRLAAHSDKRRQRLLEADTAAQSRLSAELNAVYGTIERWKPKQVTHLLIQSSTAVGEAAAKLISAALERRSRETVELRTADGLQTTDGTSFHDALSGLTKQLEETLPGYKDSGWTITFNLNGGFKSVSAFLQALGMLYADRCVFRFEGARDLMEIPRLPIQLADVEEVQRNLVIFRKIKYWYPVDERDVVGIPESLLQTLDGRVELSIWGDVVWNRAEAHVLSQTLCEPLSRRLRLTEKVRRSFDKLPNERKVQVNRALDGLAAQLDGVGVPGAANTFRPLAGKPSPPSTHELYLWTDGNASRLFGHHEGDVFVADSIDKHL